MRLASGNPQREVLALVPGGSDAEHRPPAREDVERRHDLREQAGIAVADAGDEQAERHRLGRPGDIAERRVALEHRVLGACEGLHLEVVVHAREHRAARASAASAVSRKCARSAPGPPDSVWLKK